MPNSVYIRIAVAVLALLFFLLRGKKEEGELPAKKEPGKLKAPPPRVKGDEREKEPARKKVAPVETVAETPAAKTSERPPREEREEPPARPIPPEEEFGKSSILD